MASRDSYRRWRTAELQDNPVMITERVRGCNDGRTSAERLRASSRTWKRKVSRARSGQFAGATCCSNARRSRFHPRPCRTNGACAGGTSRHKPARSRRGSPGSSSRPGCARARHGRSRPNDLRRSRPRPGTSGGKAPLRPNGRSLQADEAVEFVQPQHAAHFDRQKRLASGRRAAALISLKGASLCFYPNRDLMLA